MVNVFFLFFLVDYPLYLILGTPTMNKIHGVKIKIEPPPHLTRLMLNRARHYGFYSDNTVLGELFNGNGMMSAEAQNQNYTVITRDLYTGDIPFNFFTDPIPDGINLIFTYPPFRRMHEFFKRLLTIGIFLFFNNYILFYNLLRTYVHNIF